MANRIRATGSAPCSAMWLLLGVAVFVLGAEPADAFREPDVAAAPDYDARESLPRAVPRAEMPEPASAAQGAALEALGGGAAEAAETGVTVRRSVLTGGVSRLHNTLGPLTGPSNAAPLDIALDFVRANLALFNVTEDDLREVVLTRNYVTKHNGVTHLSIQQQVNGLDVFGATIEINISRNGEVLTVSGEPIPNLRSSARSATPLLNSDAALASAASSAEIAETEGNQVDGLVYFPLAPGVTLLAWNVVVGDAAGPNRYRTLVDATDGTVLWRQNETRYSHIATHGQVFHRDSPIPDSPIGTAVSVNRTNQLFHGGGQVFPPVLGTPLFPDADVHFDWWAGDPRTVTTSNNVRAQEDRDGNNTGGAQANAAGDDFTQALDLTMEPDTYTAASIVNLFYWNNRIHDIWYRYGFDEASGNFQDDNFGLGGAGGDPVIADAQDNRDGGSLCNANFGTPGDGASPRMQMFQCTNATPERDGDFDNVVILHEFHHGLATRLTPGLHGGLQGGGMGEGGGDFQGLAGVVEAGDDPNGSYGIGGYLFNNTGIRRAAYSIRPGAYPFTYGDVPLTGSVHSTGEIWANALWIARALLVSRYGFVAGTNAVLQLQVDGYKLSPASPDFLDMRDAILSADLADFGGINQCLLWQAFARMGMGLSASSTGNSDTNPVEAFDTPLACTPRVSLNPALVDFGPVPVNPVGGENGIKSLDFNVCNVGTSELYVTNVVLPAPPNPAFAIVPPPPEGFPLPLSPDFCHTVEARCDPSAVGVTTTTTQVESTDPLNAVVSSPTLTCTGAVPSAQVSPNPLSFGNVPTTPVGGEVGFADRSLKVRNTGNSNLQVSSIVSVGGNAGDFALLTPMTPLPAIVAAGSEFDFQIRCDPSAPGPRATTLRVTSNSGGVGGTTRDVAADCIGAVPDVRVTGASEFGDVCAEELAEQVVSVCNVGISNLDVTSAAFDPPCSDFTLVNNPFPASVSHDSCNDIVIRFTPTSAGPKSCTLVIATNDPDQPITQLAVMGNTPAPSIDVPPDQSFLPEVIQSAGACSTAQTFPVSNTGQCNLEITNVALGGTDAGDYRTSGLPSFPIILEAGDVIGEGDFQTVFAPTVIDRDRLATLTVRYESDPITGATTDVTRNLCGEGVLTGARVLVQAGGAPLALVERIQIQRITGNRNRQVVDTVDTARNLALQTVTPAAPCASFQFHREYGTVTNPIQLLPGSYRVTATAIVNGKRRNQTVAFDVTTCDFNPTITVNF